MDPRIDAFNAVRRRWDPEDGSAARCRCACSETPRETVVVLGATKGMGRALARRMVARGDRLVLLGRDPDDLAASAGDLAARAPAADVPSVRPSWTCAP